MAGEEKVQNPQQVNVSVTDQRFGYGTNGEPLWPQETKLFRASGSIPVGSIVALVPPSGATVKPAVAVKAATLPFAATVGVYNGKVAAVDGATVEVVTEGFALVLATSTTPALGDTALINAANGEVAVDLDDPDATVIAGTVLGSFLAAKGTHFGTANLAPMYVKHL